MPTIAVRTYYLDASGKLAATPATPGAKPVIFRGQSLTATQQAEADALEATLPQTEITHIRQVPSTAPDGSVAAPVVVEPINLPRPTWNPNRLQHRHQHTKPVVAPPPTPEPPRFNAGREDQGPGAAHPIPESTTQEAA